MSLQFRASERAVVGHGLDDIARPDLREHTLDILTVERRRASAADWGAAAKAVASGNGVKAEAIVRKALFESRDGAMMTLRKLRAGDVDASKFIHD